MQKNSDGDIVINHQHRRVFKQKGKDLDEDLKALRAQHGYDTKRFKGNISLNDETSRIWETLKSFLETIISQSKFPGTLAQQFRATASLIETQKYWRNTLAGGLELYSTFKKVMWLMGPIWLTSEGKPIPHNYSVDDPTTHSIFSRRPSQPVPSMLSELPPQTAETGYSGLHGLPARHGHHHDPPLFLGPPAPSNTTGRGRSPSMSDLSRGAPSTAGPRPDSPNQKTAGQTGPRFFLYKSTRVSIRIDGKSDMKVVYGSWMWCSMVSYRKRNSLSLASTFRHDV